MLGTIKAQTVAALVKHHNASIGSANHDSVFAISVVGCHPLRS